MTLEKNFLININIMHSDHTPNMLVSIIKCKCTRCRRGDMFKTRNPYDLKRFMQMNEKCPVCGQPLDMEPGFYYGTNMISYALAVLISGVSLLLWWLVIGMSLQDNRFFWWILFNAILLIAIQPPLMRVSRTVWLSFFVRYSRDWKNGDVVRQYSVNKEQSSNW